MKPIENMKKFSKKLIICCRDALASSDWLLNFFMPLGIVFSCPGWA
jgi:hypothetical protein